MYGNKLVLIEIFLLVCHPKQRPPQVYLPITFFLGFCCVSCGLWGPVFWGAKPTGKLLSLELRRICHGIVGASPGDETDHAKTGGSYQGSL